VTDPALEAAQPPLTTAEARGPAARVRPAAVGDLLRQAASDSADRIALVEGASDRSARRRWTYGGLCADAEAVARGLLQRYREGDRIAIWSPNVPEYQLVQYGVALAGMTLVTLNPAFRPEEARYVLEQSGSTACFAADRFRDRPLAATAHQLVEVVPSLQEVHQIDQLGPLMEAGKAATPLPVVDPASPAQILYTSGTTGAPKGAMLPHLGMVNNIPYAVRRIACGVEDEAVFMSVLPMFHLAGCVVAAIGSMALRGSLLTVNGFNAALVLRLIEEERITTMNLVPTMMLAMLADPTLLEHDLSSLGSIMLGGASVAPELVRRVESELGIPAIVGYGMTEAACVTMTSHLDSAEDRHNTCGRPFPGVAVRVVDPQTGAVCAPCVPGEVQTAGFHTMSGYHANPEATAAAFTSDGWYRSGDLCTIDTRGYLRVVGRSAEMIIRGGENIYPREIEDKLLLHTAVDEVAVIGLPDDYYGEVPAAFVRFRPDAHASATELREFLYERLTGVKVPAQWFFVDEFPRTPSGKIRKFVLRELWRQGSYPTAGR
jgi:fatty-acyl-CoA synthase